MSLTLVQLEQPKSTFKPSWKKSCCALIFSFKAKKKLIGRNGDQAGGLSTGFVSEAGCIKTVGPQQGVAVGFTKFVVSISTFVTFQKNLKRHFQLLKLQYSCCAQVTRGL